MLIASMNPCPCGYYGSKIKECTCSERQRNAYKSKLSGPMLDRFDIHIQVPQIEYKKLQESSKETSRDIRKRVNNAKNIQLKRYKDCNIYSNSELTPKLIEKYCKLDPQTNNFLNTSIEKLKLSTRAYSKILKLARTIADLEQKEDIMLEHILEAIQYRSLDKI